MERFPLHDGLICGEDSSKTIFYGLSEVAPAKQDRLLIKDRSFLNSSVLAHQEVELSVPFGPLAFQESGRVADFVHVDSVVSLAQGDQILNLQAEVI